MFYKILKFLSTKNNDRYIWIILIKIIESDSNIYINIRCMDFTSE